MRGLPTTNQRWYSTHLPLEVPTYLQYQPVSPSVDEGEAHQVLVQQLAMAVGHKEHPSTEGHHVEERAPANVRLDQRDGATQKPIRLARLVWCGVVW